jgi:predicted nucleic acid-binding protein
LPPWRARGRSQSPSIFGAEWPLVEGEKVEFVIEDGVTTLRRVESESNPFAKWAGRLGGLASIAEATKWQNELRSDDWTSMRTAIDSNILSALFGLEPTSVPLVELLGRCRREGALFICGTVLAEIHAIPKLTPTVLTEFLSDTGITVDAGVTLNDWRAVGLAFGKYAERLRANRDGEPKRLLADFVIGAHALAHCDRLITLDPARYRTAFPKLKLLGL